MMRISEFIWTPKVNQITMNRKLKRKFHFIFRINVIIFLISDILFIYFDIIVTLQYNKREQRHRSSGPWKETIEWESQPWLRWKLREHITLFFFSLHQGVNGAFSWFLIVCILIVVKGMPDRIKAKDLPTNEWL